MLNWHENKKQNLLKTLIPNFKLKEFICKCGKCTLTPIDSKLLTRLNRLRIACAFPIKINSAYRCPHYNLEIVKGSKYSYHMRGMAVDIALPKDSVKRKKILQYAHKYFPTVREYPDQDFVHCDVGDKREW